MPSRCCANLGCAISIQCTPLPWHFRSQHCSATALQIRSIPFLQLFQAVLCGCKPIHSTSMPPHGHASLIYACPLPIQSWLCHTLPWLISLAPCCTLADQSDSLLCCTSAIRIDAQRVVALSDLISTPQCPGSAYLTSAMPLPRASPLSASHHSRRSADRSAAYLSTATSLQFAPIRRLTASSPVITYPVFSLPLHSKSTPSRRLSRRIRSLRPCADASRFES